VDARQLPSFSLGMVTGSRICTGTVVLHPRIVMTAAHCVIDGDHASVIESIAFRPGVDAGSAPRLFRGRVARVGVSTRNRVHTVKDEPRDWAIIVLDEAPAGVRPLSLLALGRADFAGLKGRIFLPAYSEEVADRQTTPADSPCSVIDLRWDVFLHDCNVTPGSSGAPLLVRRDGRFALIGINTALLYIPDPEGGPGEFDGAAVRTASFEEALKRIVTGISQR